MPFYLKHMPKSIEQLQVTTLVFNFYFEFGELSYLTCSYLSLVLLLISNLTNGLHLHQFLVTKS